MAGVVDEGRIVGHVYPTASQCPHAEIVFLAVAEGEMWFVENADVIDHRAADVETEAGAGRDARIAALRNLLDDSRERCRVVAGRQQVLFEWPRDGTERGVIRKGSDCCDVAR